MEDGGVVELDRSAGWPPLELRVLLIDEGCLCWWETEDGEIVRQVFAGEG